MYAVIKRWTSLAAVVLLAAGCATKPQVPVAYDERRIDPAQTVIAIASSPMPEVGMSFPGADCLLCIAAAALNHTDLRAHVGKLPLEDLPKLKQMLAEKLARRGIKVKVIDEPLKIGDIPKVSTEDDLRAKRDFTVFAKRNEVDRVLVLDLRQIGVERNYQVYVPVAPPRAVVRGEAYLVNTSNGQYEWFHKIDVVRTPSGEWSEPPQFPGLTNAYFEALEVAKDELLKPF